MGRTFNEIRGKFGSTFFKDILCLRIIQQLHYCVALKNNVYIDLMWNHTCRNQLMPYLTQMEAFLSKHSSKNISTKLFQ